MAEIVERERALARLAEGNLVIEPRAPHMEILEPSTGQVWLCREPISRRDYQLFEPGDGVVKSGVAEAPMDMVGFRRSPGMTEDGPASRRMIGGREFIQVAVPELPPKRPFGDEGPRELVVHKHQTVGFDADRSIFVLVLPDGSELIQQTGDEPDPARLSRPEGWKLRKVELRRSLTIEIQEAPRTLWFPGLLSFQGPVEGLPS